MNHIKVFKTSVEDRSAAESIRNELTRLFHGYDVSFDLEDCDNVLRVESFNDPVDESVLRCVVESFGYNIEQLPQ